MVRSLMRLMAKVCVAVDGYHRSVERTPRPGPAGSEGERLGDVEVHRG